MSMYQDRGNLKSTRDLVQGDILANLPVPAVVGGSAFHLRDGPKAIVVDKSAPIPLADAKLRILGSVETLPHAMILSNTCDIFGGQENLIVAPIVEFKFRQGVDSDDRKWRDISEAATGTASPKVFYLPGSPTLTFARSEARLSRLQTISHAYLEKCIQSAGTKRVCGISAEAQIHLQWALSALFGRHPREDDDWPSDEDLKLKVAWLSVEIERGGARNEEYKIEKDRLIARLQGSQSK